jgi:LmbE family N-acetylglucosaminyl deacetylase
LLFSIHVNALYREELPSFDSNSRLLVIAPHPDDETLGCSIILQRAVRASAAIHVVYATDGDNNPWPQRLIERKWRLDATDRKRWARLRRTEALAALRVMGVRASDVHFLGLPDQGLTDLLRCDCRPTLERFAAIINDWSPTHLMVPSVADTHPDHNALAVVLRLALAQFFPRDSSISAWSYAIHGKNRTFVEHSREVPQSESETKAKIEAIRCHKTQLKLSRRRFLAYASRPERFARLTWCEPALIDGSTRSITRKSRTLSLELDFSLKPFCPSPPRVLLFGYGPGEALRCLTIQLSARPAHLEMRDIASGHCGGMAEYRGNGFGGELTIPTNIFSPAHALFVKVERRRYCFFDEAGWFEIAPVFKAQPAVLNARQAQSACDNFAAEKYHIGAKSPRRWVFLFAVVLVWLATVLSANIDRPWIGAIDYNGAVWSQAAHNILRAGLAETSGASSGFYFGPLPIPPWGYYLHHPPLLHLTITALFAVFGENEWVARLFPIGCSLASAILLWLLVRSCAGDRTATLSAAVFACMPMELRYGKMVNFEPCVLMLILGALLCLRYWMVSGKAQWKHAALALILTGLWVDWAMYVFVASLGVCWLSRWHEGRRFAGTLLMLASFSAVCYFIRIRLVRPDAWQNLAHTFVVRLGYSGSERFTEFQWLNRVLECLTAHYLLLGWLLAAVGVVILFRARRHDKNSLWLFRASVCVFAMDVFLIGVFQNQSYIHHYISFYLLAPVAVMAGIALDRTVTFFQVNFAAHKLALAGEVLVCSVVLVMGTQGLLQARELQRQFRILDYRTPEPPNLIPELGSAIRKNFPPETRVLCNFLPEYGPQLAYYAQREIFNNLSEYRFWRRYLNDLSTPVGGVVWMGSKASRDLVSKLPGGSKQFLTIGNLSFCLWKQDQLAAKKHVAGTLD